MPAKARATKTKSVNGRTVSAKSKTGDPGCSAAMSKLVLGRATGNVSPEVHKKLGECRAKSRALRQGAQHRAAGNEGKAQRLEAIAAGRKGPITAKDRLARAKEIRAERSAKRTAAPASAPSRPSLKEQAAVRRAGKGTAEERSRRLSDVAMSRFRKYDSQRGREVAAERNLDRLGTLTEYRQRNNLVDPKAAAARAAADKARAEQAAKPKPAKTSKPKAAPKPSTAPTKASSPSMPQYAAEGLANRRQRFEAARKAKREQFPGGPAAALQDAKTRRDERRRERRRENLAEARRDRAKAAKNMTPEEVRGFAGKIKAERARSQSTPEVQARIAEQRSRATVRERDKFSLFGGQTPNERPMTAAQPPKPAAPAHPSLREQAAAHRAKKGTAAERVDRIQKRAKTINEGLLGRRASLDTSIEYQRGQLRDANMMRDTSAQRQATQGINAAVAGQDKLRARNNRLASLVGRAKTKAGGGAAQPPKSSAPARPSLREQAAAYRAKKGTTAERLAAARGKINAKADALMEQNRRAKSAYDSYRGGSLDKIRELRDRFEVELPRKGRVIAKASAKVRAMDQRINPDKYQLVRGSQKRLDLAKEIKANRSALPGLRSKSQKDYETFRSMSGNLTRKKDNGSVRNAIRSAQSDKLLASTEDAIKQARVKAKNLTRQTNAARPPIAAKPPAAPPAPKPAPAPRPKSFEVTLERIGQNNAQFRGGANAYVAAVKGPDPKYGMKREFLTGNRDYGNANSVKSRGVTETYSLPRGGVYEINEPRSWKNVDRYHVVARGTGLKKVDKERALAVSTRLERFKANRAKGKATKATGRGTPERLRKARLVKDFIGPAGQRDRDEVRAYLVQKRARASARA